jgi:hypothetical protein
MNVIYDICPVMNVIYDICPVKIRKLDQEVLFHEGVIYREGVFVSNLKEKVKTINALV